MRIAFGGDHTATEMKELLGEHARSLGHEVVDLGVMPGERGDYPVYAARVAHEVVSGACERGVVICGTGIGVSIAANKVRGIRCALLSDCYSARMTRAHNDANVAAFGARVIGPEPAKMMLEIFLSTDFEGGRHARRVGQLQALGMGERVE